MIAFPDCTHLASSGARWFPEKKADGRQQAAIDFFMEMINAPIPLIAVENPIGIMSTIYRQPDQIVHPWWFGDFGENESKSTCLWLKGLPKLEKKNPLPEPHNTTVHHMPPGPCRAMDRARTFRGVAAAMAIAWGGVQPARADLRAGAVRQDPENLCIMQGEYPFWDGKKPCTGCMRCA